MMLVFVGSQVACFHGLLSTTGGEALYRTDHPSFMFRLFEFTRTFPQLVNYNPYWNGGTEHFVGVTSGIAGPGRVVRIRLRVSRGDLRAIRDPPHRLDRLRR